MGFHAPQELARILGEAIDQAWQGQLAVERTARAGSSRGMAARDPGLVRRLRPAPARRAG